MSLCVLFAAGKDSFAEYETPLLGAFVQHGLEVRLVTDATPETVDYIIYAPSSTLRDFTPFTRCKAVLSLWAGVERIVGNPTLTQPLARMVDPALTRGMVEYVCGHVLRYHLGMDAHIRALPGSWNPVEPPLAPERKVGILGLGELGSACARALADFGFDVAGWSARSKALAGIDCHHGTDGLAAVLRHSEILVTLLPQTPDTACILNARTLALLPRGARVINPGRGGLVDDDALLAALESGQVGGATLDVFRVEPLPADHPFWAHRAVTVTPHIAATTRAPSAARD
jgi:glyoxylate/hydroxypyruvate reductase